MRCAPRCRVRGAAPRPRAPSARDPPPSPDLVGRLAFRDARAEDTLVDLGPELGVGYTELVAANPGVDPWLPKEGTRLVVPNARLLPSGPREGIVVNLGDLRLYYFEPGEPPRSYPIGIAKDGYSTPLGETVVNAKREKPTWVPGESARREDPSLPRAGQARARQPARRARALSGLADLSDPRHERPARRRPPFEPRLHPALSRTTSRSSTRASRRVHACVSWTSP